MQIKVGASVCRLTRNVKFFGASMENVCLCLNCSFLLEKVKRTIVQARNNATVLKVHCKYMRRIFTFTDFRNAQIYIFSVNPETLPFPIRKKGNRGIVEMDENM